MASKEFTLLELHVHDPTLTIGNEATEPEGSSAESKQETGGSRLGPLVLLLGLGVLIVVKLLRHKRALATEEHESGKP